MGLIYGAHAALSDEAFELEWSDVSENGGRSCANGAGHDAQGEHGADVEKLSARATNFDRVLR